MRRLHNNLSLVLALAQANTIDIRVPSKPSFHLPVVFEGVAHLVPLFADLGPELSFRSFVTSLGIRALPTSKDELRGIRESSESVVLEALRQAENSSEDAARVVIPVLLRDAAVKVVWHDKTAAEEVVAEFVATRLANINATLQQHIGRVVESQLRIRDEQRRQQWEAFASASAPAFSLATYEAPGRARRRHPPSASAMVMQTMLANDQLAVIVVNLWRSHSRRLFLRHQLANQPCRVRWLSAVDGVYVPQRVILRTVADDVVLSQGELGSYLSHLTAWRDIVEAGLPAAVILEDDCHVHPNMSRIVRQALEELFVAGEDGSVEWDILALDMGLQGHYSVGAEELREFGANRACHEAASAAEVPVLKLDYACAHVSIGGYVASWRGARRLVDAALPMRMPVDIFMLEEVKHGRIDAYAVLPASAHVEAYGTSDSVRRYFRVREGQILVTYDENVRDSLTCHNLPCQLKIG
ncbi:hypothetical protein CTAYLR_008739 [Chrysophaeum taylorii]|uniref:Glycosyl transferase family 25 domain-containing protein n=1 Tax=Chrysophaeum taylorii TaxID=2483200 RepID=A0AAD7UKE9_9STRA|nr:hypothetical protein CTAYLR_008739 [Chrysophaeum taylorii]